jgi:hypothetical protein
MRCEDLRELAPEIALGIADGEQRETAMLHLADCDECRHLLEEMSQVNDELLTVAPVAEPPVGFETRVMEQLGLTSKPRRRRRAAFVMRRLAIPAAAAALTAGALVGYYHDDHVTASRYKDTLAAAGGSDFIAKPILDPAGKRAGTAFGYEGKPSWVMITVDPAYRAQVRSCEIVTKDGRHIRLAWSAWHNGSWGGSIPVDVYDIQSIRMLGERPGQVLATPASETS